MTADRHTPHCLIGWEVADMQLFVHAHTQLTWIHRDSISLTHSLLHTNTQPCNRSHVFAHTRHMSLSMSAHIDSSVSHMYTLTHCHKPRNTHLLTHMHSVRMGTHMHTPAHPQISSVHITCFHSPSHPFPHAHTVHGSKTMFLDMCVHRGAVTQMLGSRRALPTH